MARLMGGTHERRAAGMVERGIDRPVADRLAAGQGEEMGRAIPALYRSAAKPATAEMGRDLACGAGRPGPAILPPRTT